MRRFVLRVLPVLLSLVLLLSVAAAAAPKVITIINTSDFHGNLLTGQKDKSNPPRPYGGGAVVAAYIARYRAENPGGTLVLDGGDLLQGPAISTIFRGKPTVEAYNVIGYDAAAIGNHEFDWGIDALRARLSEAKFPFLSANIFLKATGQRPEWAKPYAIFERNGVKVGVIGLTTVQTPYITLPANVESLEFRDPVALANSLIPEVKGQGAQIVVLLAHIGGNVDRQGMVTDELAALAANVKGADLILGGHTHNSIVAKVDGVQVVVPYYQGRAIGVTNLTFDPEAGRVVTVESQLVTTYGDTVAPVPEVQAVIDRYNKDLEPVMAEVLAQASADIGRDYEAESALGNLVADVMRRTAGVDIAFTNAGGLRADVPAGPITLGRVWEIIPFDNTIVTMELTGAQVLEVLANRTKGMVQTSGIKFAWRDIPGNKEKREVVSATLADGRPLDPNTRYRVCTNDFMAAGGDNFVAFRSGTNVHNTQILLRDALIDFLKAEAAAGRPITPAVEGRAVRAQ
ncbi:MAG: 5'-nucleotidase C-terminal domain-containing protein [Bacillota bacterium]|nr:5'-nucleotidase C-terminal domain-containing protein [Bacillota bacterium]